MDNRAIGVFDSGLGGLTAVKQLMDLLPEEDIIYFGDTGRVPYGTRSKDTIIKYTIQDINFLKTFQIKMIVVACGTASTVALPVLQDRVDLPMVGVLSEAVTSAVRQTKNNKIGVVATPATIKSGAFERAIHAAAPQAQTYGKACPLFVPLVENGHFDTQVAELVAREYLEPLKEADIDTLIMGCTHYPLLNRVVGRIMGPQVTLVNVGEETAKYVKRYLTEQDMRAEPGKKGHYSYFVSDSVENFSHLGSMFLQREIGEMVNLVDIEKYECDSPRPLER
ncbi:MAG TPA: glutamate racemase [Candidatus Aphodoplasma excrementigallinarum]|uniref:Glutamate racemase n=1 Tax=Candidatus Aphodoplasma excrementigallinarum TaxID=2840673 RepID=A0A9D1NHA3_9FIRM|nr:glutamate racemase [Candidatus Aphodoplasma excrementigallinarum]